MLYGIFAGILWAMETVVLGAAMSMAPFISSEQGMLLAPFVSAFFHDAFSAVYMWCFNGLRGRLSDVFKIFSSKGFKLLVLSSAIGGPVGMTGYVLAVNYMGASVGAVASAIYPAIGSVLAFIFLKEDIKRYQWIFLFFTLLGVFGLSYSPELDIKNFWIGLCGVFMCAFGWGIEGVILSKCLKSENINCEYALQIRQSVSALIYGIFIIPLLNAWGISSELLKVHSTLLVVALAALCATASYLCYYKAIAKVGVAKAMGLNITYTAWAMVFSVVIFRDFSILNFTSIACFAVVVVCGILAAVDFKALFGKK